MRYKIEFFCNKLKPDSGIEWEIPIAHLIPRTPFAMTIGDTILIEMEMMAKMGTPVPYGGFPLTNLKYKMWLHLKMLINAETPLTNSICSPPSTAMVRKLT